MIERIKNILTTPKTEWVVINGENTNPQSLLMSYVLPLAAFGALGSILSGLFFPGIWTLPYFLMTALVTLLASTLSYYVSAYVIDMLAPTFKSEKDLNKSAQLVAYSSTPSFIAGILSFIPGIGWLLSLAGLVYGIYLMYLGLEPLKKTPEDQKVVYLIVAYLIIIVLYFVLLSILGLVLLSSFMVTGRAGLF